MRVLSLFDGISVAQQALHEIGAPIEVYYASEIDRHAMTVTMKNFPKTIQLGDVCKINSKNLKNIDLLIGGSPCQDLSQLKTYGQGLGGIYSGLFYEYIRVLRDIKPKYFVLENVNSMTAINRATITKIIGVPPIMFDAALVSAQSRRRLFWTNITGITKPIDKKIFIKDIVEDYVLPEDNSRKICKSAFSYVQQKKIKICNYFGKNTCLTTQHKQRNCAGFIHDTIGLRGFTSIEYERLQSLPDNYTEGITDNQRYHAIGNAFNCAVVKHILSFMEY